MQQLGDFSYTTDGSIYQCHWSPTDHPWNGPTGVLLGTISVKLLPNRAAYKQWTQEMEAKFFEIYKELTGDSDATLEITAIAGARVN